MRVLRLIQWCGRHTAKEHLGHNNNGVVTFGKQSATATKEEVISKWN
jgi:hypothetical protein